VQRLVINDRDGGIGKRGPWWVMLIWPGIWLLWAVLEWDRHPVVSILFVVFTVISVGWIIGAHVWWLRHRRGWEW